jgi:hypothetical protein
MEKKKYTIYEPKALKPSFATLSPLIFYLKNRGSISESTSPSPSSKYFATLCST